MESSKFCQYFNNSKSCPYEEIGCQFKHAVADNCKYDRKCKFKLCQYKHTQYVSSEQVEKESDKIVENEHEKFDVMDEEERFNVNEEICGKMCWQGDHKCFDKEHENELLGVDVEKIKDDFRNCVEE